MRDDLNPSSPFYVFQFHSFLKVTFPLPIALDRDLKWVKKGREKKKQQQQQKPLRAKKSAKNRGRFLDGCGLPCIYIIQVMDWVGYCKLIKGPIAASIGVPRVVYHFKKFPEIPFGKLTEHDFFLMFQRKISALRNI